LKEKITLEISERIKRLPPYPFAELDQRKAELRAKGVDLIDLGIGDPDLPTPKRIVERMRQEVLNPQNHRYPSYEGLHEFREAVSGWYARRFGVNVDPEVEVLALIGSKEGIAHVPLAFLNPGDYSLIPSPGYPVYHAGTMFAGGRSFFLPLLEEKLFLPDLSQVPDEVAEKAKLLFINYPNNPTGVVADKGFFAEVVKFAQQYHLIVCHDAAYSEIFFDGYTPSSFLEVDGAKEVGLEFHSLSKTYNMTGWRLGYMVAPVKMAERLQDYLVSAISCTAAFTQWAGIEALTGDQSFIYDMMKRFKTKRDKIVKGLNSIPGFTCLSPKGAFYTFPNIKETGMNSQECADHLLYNAGVACLPGTAFGPYGEGYLRFSYATTLENIDEAIERINDSFK